MRSAIIADGFVVNVIMGETPDSIPCGDGVGKGWSWDGATFAAPPAPEPEPEPTYEELLAQAQANRRNAYTQESDPLFFKWQRGTATEQEWLDKIAEIKVRYPDPEVPA